MPRLKRGKEKESRSTKKHAARSKRCLLAVSKHHRSRVSFYTSWLYLIGQRTHTEAYIGSEKAAVKLLRQCNWKVNAAIDAYYDSLGSAGSASTHSSSSQAGMPSGSSSLASSSESLARNGKGKEDALNAFFDLYKGAHYFLTRKEEKKNATLNDRTHPFSSTSFDR